jgi:dTDP-4-amino-4,6-dideoxygalactose transaminase
LSKNSVETVIHYPIPPHKQVAYNSLKSKDLRLTEDLHKSVLSLPMGSHLTNSDVDTVIYLLNEFI